MPHKLKQIIAHPFVQHKPLVHSSGSWSQILQTDVHNLFVNSKMTSVTFFSIFKCKAATCLQLMGLSFPLVVILRQSGKMVPTAPVVLWMDQGSTNILLSVV